MYECMYELTIGQMDEWMSGRMDLDEWTNELLMNKQTNEWTGGRMDEWTTKRMDEWTNQIMDAYAHKFRLDE